MLDLSEYELDFHERTTVLGLMYAKKYGQLTSANLRTMAEKILFTSWSCGGSRGGPLDKERRLKNILKSFRDLQKKKVVL